jgi:hypothetical protein
VASTTDLRTLASAGERCRERSGLHSVEAASLDRRESSLDEPTIGADGACRRIRSSGCIIRELNAGTRDAARSCATRFCEMADTGRVEETQHRRRRPIAKERAAFCSLQSSRFLR